MSLQLNDVLNARRNFADDDYWHATMFSMLVNVICGMVNRRAQVTVGVVIGKLSACG